MASPLGLVFPMILREACPFSRLRFSPQDPMGLVSCQSGLVESLNCTLGGVL